MDHHFHVCLLLVIGNNHWLKDILDINGKDYSKCFSCNSCENDKELLNYEICYYRGLSPGYPLPFPLGGGGRRLSCFLLSPAKFTSKQQHNNRWKH